MGGVTDPDDLPDLARIRDDVDRFAEEVRRDRRPGQGFVADHRSPESVSRPFAVRFRDASGPLRGARLADAANDALAAIEDPDHLLGHIAEWLLDQNKHSTRDAYAADLERFSAWCFDQGLSLDAVTGRDVKRWKHHMAGEVIGTRPGPDGEEVPRLLSAATIRRRLASMSSLYGHLTAADVVDKSPFAGVRRDPPERGVEDRPGRSGTAEPPPREEIIRLRDHAAAEHPVWGALVWLLYSSALRIGEVCSARREDLVDGDPSSLWIVGKGRAEDRRERVPVDAEAVELLRAHHALERVEGYGPLLVRPGGDGARLSRQLAYNNLTRLGREVFGPDGHHAHPHVFRAAATTHMIESGVPLREVQLAMRHASSTTTEGYDRRARAVADSPLLTLWADE